MASDWDVVGTTPMAAPQQSGAAAGNPYDVVHETPIPKPAWWQPWLARAAGAAQGAVVDPLMGIAQTAANFGGMNPVIDSDPTYADIQKPGAAAINKDVASENNAYENLRNSAGQKGFDWMRAAGGVLPAMIAPEAQGLKDAALIGGTYALAQPVTDGGDDLAQQKLKQIGEGAVGGVVGQKVGNVVGGAISPVAAKSLQTLRDAGIPLTMGQITGGMGRTIENSLTSVPIVGDMIKGAQQRSFDALNRGAVNRALEPIGETLPDEIATGRPAVDYAAKKLSDAYENLLPKLSAQSDPQFSAEVLGHMANAASSLPDQQASQFWKIADGQIFKKMQNGGFDGQTLKGIESQLGTMAKGYNADPNFDNRTLGSMVGDLQDSVRDLVTRANPDAADQLSAINKGYANFARVRRAASSTGAIDGVFTPAQLAAAVKASDGSVGKGAYARGTALMQDLSDAAKSILPSNVADSGTAGRGMMGVLAGGLAGGMAHGGMTGMVDHLPYLAAPLSLAGAYTRPGQKFMEHLLLDRPNFATPVANAVRRVSVPTALSFGQPAMQSYFSPMMAGAQ